ncbi:MAG: hypothetical protein KTR31_21195, partial [Myxococcales bacterium]|nr:hypothetical protein [Myxococcales bacterium]
KSSQEFCRDLQETNAGGEVRTVSFDDRCQPVTETFRGVTTTRAFDGLGRVTSVRRSMGNHPSGDPIPDLLEETIYDDSSWFSGGGYWFRDTTQPSKAVRDQDGNLRFTYTDEYGRETLTETCGGLPAGSASVTAPSDLSCTCTVTADGQCSIKKRSTWRGYSVQGKEMATAPSFRAGQTVVASLSLLDAYGRVQTMQTPSHDGAYPPTWETTHHYLAPHRLVTVDPLLRVSVDEKTSMRLLQRRAGQVVGDHTLDRIGEAATVVTQDATRHFGYDGRGRPEDVWRDQQASIFQQNGAVVVSNHHEVSQYNDAGAVKLLIQADQTQIATQYDAFGRPVATSVNDGTTTTPLHTITYGTTAEGHLTERVTDRDDSWVETVTDGLGRVLMEHDSQGIVEHRFYDGPLVGNGGRRLRTVVHDGTRTLTTIETYDGLGDLVHLSTPHAGSTQFEHEGSGQLVAQVDADNVRTEYDYTWSGQLLEQRVGPYVLTRRTYDEMGRLQTEGTSDGLRTLTYDALDRVSHIARGTATPATVGISFVYDGVSNRVSQKTILPTALGMSIWNYHYDHWGRLVLQVNPDATVRKWTYDAQDRPRKYVDEEDYVQITHYDVSGLLIHEEALGRNTIDTAYTFGLRAGDPLIAHPNVDYHRIEYKTDAAGIETRTYFDGGGRPLVTVYPDGRQTEYSYDGSRVTTDQLVGPDGSTVVEQIDFTYDAQGRPATEVGPYDPAQTLRPTQSFTYTPAGRAQTLDREGETTTLVYDVNGMVEQEQFLGLTKTYSYKSGPGGVGVLMATHSLAPDASLTNQRVSTFGHDELGRPTSIVANDGFTTVTRTFTGHDAFDNPGLAAVTTSAALLSSSVDTTFGYDGRGRLTTRTHEINGDGILRTTTLAYFDNGVLQSQAGPAGPPVVFDYGPSFDHEVDNVRAGATTVFGIQDRDDVGRVTELNRTFGGPGSVESRTYDVMGRLEERAEVGMAPGVVDKVWTLTRDDRGLLTSSSQDHNGVIYDNAYTYDGGGRLVSETVGMTGETVNYTLDSAGRRLVTEVIDGATIVQQNLTYDGHGVLTKLDALDVIRDSWLGVTTNHDGAAFARDANGSVIGSTVGADSVTYIRDAFGLPIARQVGETLRVTHWHPLDPGGDPVEERLPGGQVIVFAPGPTATQRLTYNALGNLVESVTLDPNLTKSPMAEDGTERNSGTSFGVGAQPSPSVLSDDLFSFAGMQAVPGTDQLHMARHRVLDSTTGQFLSPDPAGMFGGFHRFLYANANPVSFADPMGLSAECTDPAQLVNHANVTVPQSTTGKGHEVSEQFPEGSNAGDLSIVRSERVYADDSAEDSESEGEKDAEKCEGQGCTAAGGGTDPEGQDATSTQPGAEAGEIQELEPGEADDATSTDDMGSDVASVPSKLNELLKTVDFGFGGEITVHANGEQGTFRNARHRKRVGKRAVRRAGKLLKKLDRLKKRYGEVMAEHGPLFLKSLMVGALESANPFQLWSVTKLFSGQGWREFKKQLSSPEGMKDFIVSMIPGGSVAAALGDLVTAVEEGGDDQATAAAVGALGQAMGGMFIDVAIGLGTAGLGTAKFLASGARKVARRVGKGRGRRGCRLQSFVAGTSVHAVDGTRSIEEVKRGDLVLARAPAVVHGPWVSLEDVSACVPRWVQGATLGLALAACDGDALAAEPLGEDAVVQAYDAREGDWDDTPVWALGEGAELLWDGHVLQKTGSDFWDKGAVTAHALERADAAWSLSAMMPVPEATDWVRVVGEDSRHERAADVLP